MNDWNPTEHQLRSWTPRCPSQKLRQTLFPQSGQAVIESPSAIAGRWAWLAPVMGCFLAVMVLSGMRTPQLGVVTTTNTDWLTAVANNQSYAAYAAGNFHSEQNALQDPIQWTNGARTTERGGTLPLVKTNTLTQ